MRRANILIAAAAAISIMLLWVAPPVGFIAALVMLVLAPPWGRSLAERAIISGLVVVGVVATIFPSGSTTPITATSAHLLLSFAVGFGAALRFLPWFGNLRIPRPRVSDGIILLLAAGLLFWLVNPFLGMGSGAVLSGVLLMGWDNLSHFATFANSIIAQSNSWVTLDGTVAWNQWYPNVHTTIWALAHQAIDTTVPLSRAELLFPYVLWSAISVAFSLAALAWLAGDLAERFAKMRDISMAAAGIAAVLGFGVFAVFGSPTRLFNAGFTNFLMAVTTVAVASYLAARSWQSARKLGWFVLPAAAMISIGLWTPLVVALVIPGVIVLVALWRVKPIVAISWALITLALIAFVAIRQALAILGADRSVSVAEFTQSLGSVPVGMVGFNIAAAISFPLIVLISGGVLVRDKKIYLAAATAGPVLGIAVVLFVVVRSSVTAEVAWQISYYVLKVLNALLLVSAPIVAALLAASLVIVVRSVGRVMAVAGSVVAVLLGVALFGYIGPSPVSLNPGFQASPAILAAAERRETVANAGIGDAILSAVDMASDYPDRAPLPWDVPGALPSLWVGTLHDTLSQAQQSVYIGLPTPPYEERGVDYLTLSLNAQPALNLVLLWTDPESEKFVRELVTRKPEQAIAAN